LRVKYAAFEPVSIDSLATVVGGEKPTMKEAFDGLGDMLDRMIAARPFEKICREAGNCYDGDRKRRRRR
jgi:hypothetical protein